ncbi:hypothetical protein SCALM49S_02353 [Streptomyces californicus]
MPDDVQTAVADDGQNALRADCANCFGLCCIALTLTASSDFAIDKEAGRPCPNLRDDFGCGIHARLRAKGFPGCTVYDCFGAGQKVSQQTYGGRDWRSYADHAAQMFQLFPVMRQLHELLWYLTEALARPEARSLHTELRRALEETERHTARPAVDFAALDVGGHRDQAAGLLRRTSGLVRATAPRRTKRNRAGAVLLGARLRGADLRGADLLGPARAPATPPTLTRCARPRRRMAGVETGVGRRHRAPRRPPHGPPLVAALEDHADVGAVPIAAHGGAQVLRAPTSHRRGVAELRVDLCRGGFDDDAVRYGHSAGHGATPRPRPSAIPLRAPHGPRDGGPGAPPYSPVGRMGSPAADIRSGRGPKAARRPTRRGRWSPQGNGGTTCACRPFECPCRSCPPDGEGCPTAPDATGPFWSPSPHGPLIEGAS